MKNHLNATTERRLQRGYSWALVLAAVVVGVEVGSSRLFTLPGAGIGAILGVGCVGTVCMVVAGLNRPPRLRALWQASFTSASSVLAFTRYPWLAGIAVARVVVSGVTLPNREVRGWPAVLAIVFPLALAVLGAAVAPMR